MGRPIINFSRPNQPQDACHARRAGPHAPAASADASRKTQTWQFVWWAAALWSTLVLFVAAAPSIAAETSDDAASSDARSRLIAKAAAAQRDFVPLTLDQLAADAKSLRQAQSRLNSKLNRWGKTGDGWRTYLKWQDVDQQIAARDGGDSVIFEQVAARLDSGHDGLALAEFKAFRKAMVRYLRTLRAVQLNDAETMFNDRIDDLRAALADGTGPLSDEARERLGAATGWLKQHGLAPELVAEVETVYGQPNVFLQVDGNVLLAGMQEEISEQLPINDVIQGARVRGTGKLTGYVRFRLTPDPNRAAFEMYSDAMIRSSIRGYSDPAGFTGSGVTRISASKRVYLDLDGMIEESAQARASTRMRTHGVWTRFRRPLINRIGTRIASRQIAASRPASERTVSTRAARQFKQRFEDQAAPMLAEANEAFIYAMRVPMAEQGLLPRKLHLSTTTQHIRARAVQANDFQLAADTAPPTLDSSPIVALKMHESAINNSANNALAGRTLESYELSELQSLMFGGPPLDFAADDGAWNMVLADHDPLSVDVADGAITIRLQGQHYADSTLTSDLPVEVGARYVSTMTAEGPALLRDGPMWARASGSGPEFQLTSTAECGSLEQSAVEQTLAKRFAPIFAETLALEPIEIPMDPQGRQLVARQCRLEGGWIAIGFDE